ncbi:adenylyltransferase/cytidyltransferase family protein [Fontivita pretiosa]|uniref:adenylyltransferase/cytidyltransferase family protein n=1 Tax=Fontivita pretiosa TaxID=2989684 RepID=UPI003D180B7E
MKTILVSSSFDDMRFADFRFLEEAGRLGQSLHALLWSDELVQRLTGKPPKFPQAERQYLLGAIRYVGQIAVVNDLRSYPDVEAQVYAVREGEDTPAGRQWASSNGIEYRVIEERVLKLVPPPPAVPLNPRSSRPKVVVTGCFDYFHSGHVRFFEECSELGDLYVVVGHDANIRLLKGEGHPLFPATERRYIVGSIRYVTEALISSGQGWMDAEPEFLKIRPDIYVVNEDGDRPEKRAFCQDHGIEYRVLKRLPKPGLARRSSTSLRGF